jgi:hypothetical protein
MSIELTMATTQVWWQARQRQEDRPEHWKVSADVWASVACEPQHRHVGDFQLAVVNVNANRHPLDPMELGGWAVEFMEHGLPDGPEDAIFAKRGAQVKGRDPKVAFLRGFKLAGGWQGHGLAGPLIAATLDRFSGIAQLGVCRVSGADFIDDSPGRTSAELTCTRVQALLEEIGFYRWREVHVLDLRTWDMSAADLWRLDRWAPANESDEERGDRK